MTNTILTLEMKKMLKRMVGEFLLDYECTKINDTETFGNIRLYLDGLTLEITNEVHEEKIFNEDEDITYFEVKEVDKNAPFKPYLVKDFKKFPVNKTITGLEIINDQIDVENGTYTFSYDQALVIHMGNDVLMLARDVWFIETIFITSNDNLEEVCPLSDIIETMSCNDEYDVKINRTRNWL